MISKQTYLRYNGKNWKDFLKRRDNTPGYESKHRQP